MAGNIILYRRPPRHSFVELDANEKSDVWGDIKVMESRDLPEQDHLRTIDEANGSRGEVVLESPKPSRGRGRGRGKIRSGEAAPPGMTAAERERQFEKARLERFIREVDQCRARPVRHVSFEGATSPGDAKRGKELVLQFEIPKYELKLKVTLPKKYPEEAPVLQFISKIPIHPEVDQSTGKILRFWPSTEQCYTPDSPIRNMMTVVAGMMKKATFSAVPPVESLLPGTTFPLTKTEFHHFLEAGPAEFVNKLKGSHGCRVKYRGMDKRSKIKDPHFLISGTPSSVEQVTEALDSYLCEHGFRREKTYFAGQGTDEDVDATFIDHDDPSLDESQPLPDPKPSASSAISIDWGVSPISAPAPTDYFVHAIDLGLIEPSANDLVSLFIDSGDSRSICSDAIDLIDL